MRLPADVAGRLADVALRVSKFETWPAWPKKGKASRDLQEAAIGAVGWVAVFRGLIRSRSMPSALDAASRADALYVRYSGDTARPFRLVLQEWVDSLDEKADRLRLEADRYAERANDEEGERADRLWARFDALVAKAERAEDFADRVRQEVGGYRVLDWS